jgi:hypothetical protein
MTRVIGGNGRIVAGSARAAMRHGYAGSARETRSSRSPTTPANTYDCTEVGMPERCAGCVRRSLPILRTLGPKMKAPGGTGPTGASVEEVMMHHRDLLPKIMLILRIRVKIIIVRR